MDPILAELRAALADLTPEIPSIPFFSTVDRGLHVAAAGRRLLGGQRAPASAVQPGHRRGRRRTRHLHRDQRAPDPDPCRQRHAGVAPAHHHSVGHAVARRRRRGQLPHQPQHRSHQPAAADAAPGRAASACCRPRRGTTAGTGSTLRPSITPDQRALPPVTIRDVHTDGPIPAEWYCELGLAGPRAVGDPATGRRQLVAGASPTPTVAMRSAASLATIRRVTVLAAVAAGRRCRPEAALTDALAGVTHVLYAPQAPRRPVRFRVRAIELFNAARRLTASAACADIDVPAATAVICSRATPSRSAKVTGPIPSRRCCGAWAARWRWSIPKSGAASSMSTSRCPLRLAARLCGGRGPRRTMARTRSSTGPGLRRVPRLQQGIPAVRPPRLSSTRTAAIWSSARPATSGRT